MCCLGNNGNNLYIKIYTKVEIPERKWTQVSTIEYYLKQYQVIENIVNFTDVQLKGLEILTYHIRDVDIANKYATQL